MSPRDEGFTLIEMLAATAVMLVVIGAIAGLTNPASGIFGTQLERMDMQQRFRVGVDTLQKDLLMAGAGTYAGEHRRPLGSDSAAILPYRIGSASSDADGSFFDDRFTVIYVPSTAAEASLRDMSPVGASQLSLNAEPGCPPADPSCGFTPGMTAVVMDGTGARDLFKVIDVQGSMLHVRHLGSGGSHLYAAGSSISEATMFIYWLKTDMAAHTYQLMRYDGDATDVPVVDNVVGLSFEYFGDGVPPQLFSAPDQRSTYGPNPPALEHDNPEDAWGAGENCAFAISSGAQVPRLGWLASAGLVPLAAAQLTDGPWCPDGATPGRYDADLLRIRKIRVTLRVQASDASLRGLAGGLFRHGGSSLGGQRFVPDHEIRFDITPRNLRGRAR